MYGSHISGSKIAEYPVCPVSPKPICIQASSIGIAFNMTVGSRPHARVHVLHDVELAR